MKEIVCFTLFYPENFQTTGDLPQVICALTKEQLQMCCSHDAFCANTTCHLARNKYIHLLKQHYFNKVLKEPFAWKLNHPIIILFLFGFFLHIFIYIKELSYILRNILIIYLFFIKKWDYFVMAQFIIQKTPLPYIYSVMRAMYKVAVTVLFLSNTLKTWAW